MTFVVRLTAAAVLAAAASGCASLGETTLKMAMSEQRPAIESQPTTTGDVVSARPRPANPPPGFVSFCQRFPDQCAAPKNPAQDVLLDDDTWQMLDAVNRTTNAAIKPEDDMIHYGLEEFWTIPTDGYGDCDDYVVAKRKALMDLGLPSSALRIAIVFTSGFVRHAVLTVRTDRGSYVLDNMRDDILPWDKTGYDWIKRQDPASRSGWAYF